MSLCFSLMAVGGFLYVFETRRPATYLKRSRKARRKITILKYAIILAFIVLVFGSQWLFVENLFI